MRYSNRLLPDKYSAVNIESYGKGDKGDPGVGFKLTDDGEYDIQSKRMVNVKQGTGHNDVVTKCQIQLLDGARPSYVTNNKAAIYSSTGALHTQSLYLNDNEGDSGN